MCFSLKTAFIHAVFSALFIYSTACFSASFDYLYIEASEGNSSGGHVAIGFDDEIFHYQHLDSGLIRLVRQDKNDFQFQYRFLQNRRIHLSRIEVATETFDLLKTHFKQRFLAQAQQFKQLDDLHKDRVLISRLLKKFDRDDSFQEGYFSSELRLKGVGLFYAERKAAGKDTGSHAQNLYETDSIQSSHILERLRRKIEQNHGQGFLLRRHEYLKTQLRDLIPSPWPTVTPVLNQENFPPAVYSFADKYSDYLTALLGIKVLTELRSLRADSFFVTDQQAFVLGEKERTALIGLRNQLEDSLLQSVNSGRPDWGYAVLVNLARLIAIESSLRLGRWVFIDDYDAASEWLSADQFAQYRKQMQIQINDAQANLNLQRNTLSTAENITETDYSRLEMSANRYFELLKGRQNRDIRYIGEGALPTKSISLPDWIIPKLTPQQLLEALKDLDIYENRLFQELEKHYHYDLITRNCVTELFRTIDDALLQQGEDESNQLKADELALKVSNEHLGGSISTFYNFVPFMSFLSVQHHYPVAATRILNSFRGQQMERLYTRQNDFLIALRESNIFSNTLYTYNPDDALFIFFTDDQLLLRPFFGLFNTVAGVGQSVFGIFSLPFDAGNNLKLGATGVLMSLPELLFFNMRKGSYKYLSYHQMMNTEK